VSTIAIVPLKRFADAKQRLSPALDPTARRMLVAAMADDVLAALRATRGVAATLIVTREPEAVALAHERGATPVPDPGDSLDGAVSAGLRAAAARGATRALIVSGDCPALDPAELDALLAEPLAPAPASHPGASVVVVPDRHGDGTNALLLAPPDAIAPAFGPGSRARHVTAARAAGARVRLAHAPSLALDVDTREDLERLERALAGGWTSGRAAHTRRALTSLTTAPAPR